MKVFRKILKAREVSSFCFLVILFIVVGIINPSFLRAENITACFNTSVVYTLIAVGMAFTIFTGEIDVSVGSNLGLVAAVVGTMIQNGENWFLAFAVGLVIGVVVGLFNGWGVSIMKVPSLIFTLGTNGILRGLMYLTVGVQQVNQLPKSFKDISSMTLLGDFTIYYCCAVALTILIHFLLTRTRKGRYFIAVGDNEGGAELVGIPAKATKVWAYVICGLLSAVGGIIFASRIGIVTSLSGNGYEMKAVAACVLGGISLSGGVGTVLGAAIGAVIMASISYLLVFMGFSSNYDNAITGIILMTIVVVDSLLQRRAAVKNRRARLEARTEKVIREDVQ